MAENNRHALDAPPPLKSHKGFLSNTGPDPLINHKATNMAKPTSNVGPSSACQRNAIKMAFRWRASGDPLLVLFVSFLISSITKKAFVRIDPL